ncbi:MAG TPA: META domain-containing protein [Usitatibacter sp.]|nr:META domain-containing protein [Usitatibacter sp.]
MKTSHRVLLAGVAIGLAACAVPQKEPPPKPFTGTHWQVVLELPLTGEQPNFRFGDGRVEGFGGCNQVTARYVQDTVGARAIAIGRIEAGRRACDVNVRAAEARVLEVLQSVSSYSITADTMTMTGSAGTLKFRALPTELKP